VWLVSAKADETTVDVREASWASTTFMSVQFAGATA
jgi:hypothetical protein